MTAWRSTLGEGSIVVVLDSGCDPVMPSVHPVEVRSFLRRPRPADPSKHGSKVSQIIAGQHPTRMGVAPLCRLYVAQVVDGSRNDYAAILEALRWARELQADVINMSFAMLSPDRQIKAQLDWLDGQRTICVSSSSPILPYPHSWDSVLSVGSQGKVTPADVRTSSTGQVLMPNGQAVRFTGTSLSSALVAGLAACAKSFDRSINRDQFFQTLKPANYRDGTQ